MSQAKLRWTREWVPFLNDGYGQGLNHEWLLSHHFVVSFSLGQRLSVLQCQYVWFKRTMCHNFQKNPPITRLQRPFRKLYGLLLVNTTVRARNQACDRNKGRLNLDSAANAVWGYRQGIAALRQPTWYSRFLLSFLKSPRCGGCFSTRGRFAWLQNSVCCLIGKPKLWAVRWQGTIIIDNN